MKFTKPVLSIVVGLALASVLGWSHLAARQSKEWKSGIVWPEPAIVTPGTDNAPPSDAIVLFDGKDLSQWKDGDKWTIQDGYAIVTKANIVTKESFGDCQLHIEFATPAEVKGSGQGRGNSGIFLMNKYEIQVLDSYDNKTYFDGQCASIYKQTPPMVNACRKPGEWQTYDILFEAPRFDADKKLVRPGYVTLLHNGIVALNHFEIQGSTHFDKPPAYEPHGEKGPIHIQNHGNPVRFRNIWIREMKPIVGTKP